MLPNLAGVADALTARLERGGLALVEHAVNAIGRPVFRAEAKRADAPVKAVVGAHLDIELCGIFTMDGQGSFLPRTAACQPAK